MEEILTALLADKALTLKVLGQHPELVDPIGSYLVLRMIKPPDTTAGGVYLADTLQDKNKPVLAEVVKAGPGQRGMVDGRHHGNSCAPGDLVLVVKHTPYEVNLQGETFWIGFEGDVLGRIDQAALLEQVRQEKAALQEAAAEPEPAETDEKVVEEDPTGTITQRPSGLLVATLKPEG